MHIEISAGGLTGAIAISEYQSNMNSFISHEESVISSFKAVSSATYALNGGAGNLQTAVDNINARIQTETQKKADASNVLQKSNDFIDLAVMVDNQVASLVNSNKEEFYQVNPWLKPVVSEEEDVPWYEAAWNWLCDTADAVADAAKQVGAWIKDTAVKAWNAVSEFYQEHKKIIDTVLIMVGAVAAIAAVIATGGVALVPLLGALGLSTSAAIAVSTAVAVVAVVSMAGSSILNVIDIWFEIDNPVFNTFQKALNIISTVSNLAYSIGNIYNAVKKINPQEYIASHSVENLTPGTGGQTADLASYSAEGTSADPGIQFDDNIYVEESRYHNEYFVKGDHYDDFTEFYYSETGEYSYVPTENPQIEYVNAKDIEGVYLYDNEVQNPSGFWTRSGNRTKEGYFEVVEHLEDYGPIRVNKVNDSFYTFIDDGRHRVIISKIKDIKIPVIVKGNYIK